MNYPTRKKFPPPLVDAPYPLDVVLWPIREHPEKPESKRVEAILELLCRLQGDLDSSEKAKVLTRLGAALKRYTWLRRVTCTKQGIRVIHTVAGREALTRDEIWESESVGRLLDAVPDLGGRPRIRRCAQCAEWFFAVKRDDQLYCSGVCRQRHYDNSPEMRAAKATYMREKYRPVAAEREEDAKKAAGFKGKVTHRAGVKAKRTA